MSAPFFNRTYVVTQIFLTFSITFFISHTQSQATMIWLGPPDEVCDWFDTSNWLNPSPDDFFDFVIDNGGTAQISAGSASGTHGVIGDLYEGTLLQTGGLLTLQSSLRLGDNFGSLGHYELTGGEAIMGLNVGAIGDGEFIFSGGVLTTSGIGIGKHATNQGTVHHSGGFLQGTPGSVSPDIDLGSNSGGVGTYFLSGSGQVQIPSVRILNGSFVQSGGLLNISEDLLVSGNTSTIATFQLEAGKPNFTAGRIFVDGYGDSLHTQYEQDGGESEATYTFVYHGLFKIDDGLLTTTNLYVGSPISTYRPQAEGYFAQNGGHVVVNDQLEITGTIQNERTASGRYDMYAGTLEVNRIRIYSEYEAVFHQTGGNVFVDHLEINWDVNRTLECDYIMEGGTLHVDRELIVAESGNYHVGGFDFSGQAVTITTGEESFVKIGSKATFVGAENATLRIGPNSIMTIPESLDLGTVFGTYERNDAIYYHEGKPVYVGVGERAQIAGWDLFKDGFIVDGRVYDDPSRGAADVEGQLRVNPGGCVELKSTSSWFIPGASDCGVFGGIATVGHLELDTSSGKPILFQVDNDGKLVSKDVILLEGDGDSCTLRLDSGRIEAREIQVLNSGACYQQNGGTASVDKMSLIPRGVVEIDSGTLHVGVLEISSLSQLHQNGGTVEAHTLYIYESEYIMDGGALHISGDLSVGYNRPENKPRINLSNSAAVVCVEGAILR
ncbi:MAG: hypothetical protein JW829_06715, partial [Pirellulales bacterium]|nr:hypothetical protein [Pirellulales bacterium]